MEFYCCKCGKCCKDKLFIDSWVIIYPFELQKLADFLQCKPSNFVKIYCKKKIIRYNDKKLIFFVLKKHNKQCIFLKDNLCSIYEARPIQCEKAPYGYFANKEIWKHMDCIKGIDYPNVNTKEEDKKLVRNLMNGYNLEI